MLLTDPHPTAELGDFVEATATVIAVEDGYAVLEPQRTSGCASCSAVGQCGTAALGGVFGRKRNLLRIENSFEAVPGEQVIIGIPEGDLVLASLFAYVLPLVTMIAAALAALSFGAGDGIAGLAALAGFGFGLWLSCRLTKRADDRFMPRFLRRAPAGFGASCQR